MLIPSIVSELNQKFCPVAASVRLAFLVLPELIGWRIPRRRIQPAATEPYVKSVASSVSAAGTSASAVS